ncbi:hypothetical protein [Nostoc sp. PCC 7120 = FACHB-418]|uniref:pPIWI_RE_Z domain-containing protein n=1 Tax=Nostoc sp. (strain PCC 7120 / SAG 25.82 / UTEX 2576) TaxID=103690 RepID=UPI00000CE28E|nr:hypothetical protein [Nostoc sp. PCC 7120 = FACHB-418]BAB73673.1 all1974 [Nostoc sp. PCC 7120 = FACHB-418]
MSQKTLFELPREFIDRLEQLKDEGLERIQAELLLQVELCFVLMERLGLDDEPVTAPWAVLSGMPLRHPRLQNLDEMARKAIANARQIAPFSARFAWLAALRSYLKIPLDWRNYGDFTPQNWDIYIIHAAKNLRHPANQDVYERCLIANLNFRLRKVQQVELDVAYQFEAKTGEQTVIVPIKFTQQQVRNAQIQHLPWFATSRSRSSFSLRISDLEQDAAWIDEREEALTRQYGWDETAKGHWVNRFRKINFHRVQENATLLQQEERILELDGFTNIAGMVASGKTTFSQLLTVNIVRHHGDRRITLVVSDVQSAIKLANQINWWFCDDPENDEPIAVPILGRSKRDAHLRSFSTSKDYLEHQQRGQPHWGERWLGTACPLQGQINKRSFQEFLNNKPLKPGTEPCYSLQKMPASDVYDGLRLRARRSKSRGSFYLCPFFAKCPSQQVYHDMPNARVWITTPGAMAMAGLPRHLELRPMKIGELVYEQSDFVVFDEVETVIKWFDDTYAEEVVLTDGGKNGVFDDIGVKTEQFSTTNRVMPPLTQRWTGAERDAQKAITATLTLLDKHFGHQILRDWIKRGYFTPNTLLFKFARRLAGLEEFESPETPEAHSQANARLIKPIVRYFDALLNEEDPLRMDSPENPSQNPVYRLAALMQEINSTGESALDDKIYIACRAWILEFFPNTQRRLERLRTELENRQHSSPQSSNENEVDTIETLAYRLQFALTIALLDRHTRIVFYEWQNRPQSITDDSPHQRMPTAMLNILPLPLTGRQFGTYYSKDNESDKKSKNRSNNALTLFAYTNIGRCYILNFHHLLTDFNGQRGPNVLALSGTSYLPHSTSFHVGNPQGILMPEQEAIKAIAQSYFKFLPQFNQKNQPLRISGSAERKKMGLFQEIARSLIGSNGTGHLGQELKELRHLGDDANYHWRDRDRILLLVNSYDQARWVAKEIGNCWSSMQDSVYHLVPDNTDTYTENDFDEIDRLLQPTDKGALNRADIETFGQTNGRILVAPMSAMGRGFNILNGNGKAAFGSVYFLTRPYPHPHDTQAIAQEMNRRALDWVDKDAFTAWLQGDGVVQRAEKVRQLAARYWRSVEQRSYYKTLRDDKELLAYPRFDLAATTAGLVIQAVGRLLRGGVPFRAYFVDAAWAPKSAARIANPELNENDTEQTSLLVAMILRICDYASEENSVGNALYQPLAEAMETINDLYF